MAFQSFNNHSTVFKNITPLMSTSLKKAKIVSVTDTTTDTTFSLLIFHYVFAIVKSMNKLILILGSVLILSACGPSQEERNEESSKTTQKIEKTYQSFK